MILSQILFKNPLSLIYIPVWIIEARKGIDEEYNKAIKKEETNREENRVLAEKWLINTYGDIISEATTIEFSNRSQGWGVDSVFRIESPFATGSIYVNSETKKVDGGFNLMSIKFQHQYSEWVKKQVGIDDDNVEFQFAGNFDNPYIEFDKITSLSEDYREIFENTHNLYAWLCEVSSIRDLTDENIIEIAKNIRENYLLKAIQITKIPTDKKFGGRIRISSGENTSEKSIVYNVDFDINSLSDNFSDMEYRKYD